MRKISLDYLGVPEKQDKPDEYVYEKFREQLGQGPGEYYGTNLIWKENHLLLQNNERISLGRLKNLIRNLNCSKSLEAYDKVMQEKKLEIFKRVIKYYTYHIGLSFVSLPNQLS